MASAHELLEFQSMKAELAAIIEEVADHWDRVPLEADSLVFSWDGRMTIFVPVKEKGRGHVRELSMGWHRFKLTAVEKYQQTNHKDESVKGSVVVDRDGEVRLLVRHAPSGWSWQQLPKGTAKAVSAPEPSRYDVLMRDD